MSTFYVPDFRQEHGFVGGLKDLYVRLLGLPFYPRRVEARYVFPALGDVKGKHILDLGCGDGIFSIELAKRGAAVEALDISTDSLKRSQWRLEHLGLKQRVNFVRSTADTLPYKDAIFDAVLSNCVMEHIPRDEETFKEVNRVLKPGGQLVITITTDFARQKDMPLRLARALCRAPRRVRASIGSEALKRAKNFQEYAELILIPYEHARFGYSEAEIEAKLKRAGLEMVSLRSYMKAFGSMGLDLIEALAAFKVKKSGPFGYESKYDWVYGVSFPIFWVISFLDYVLPSWAPCRGFAVIARKT